MYVYQEPSPRFKMPTKQFLETVKCPGIGKKKIDDIAASFPTVGDMINGVILGKLTDIRGISKKSVQDLLPILIKFCR